MSVIISGFLETCGLQVFGPNAINSYSLLEKLRQQGEVVQIGSEIVVAENKWKRCCLIAGFLQGELNKADSKPNKSKSF